MIRIAALALGSVSVLAVHAADFKDPYANATPPAPEAEAAAPVSSVGISRRGMAIIEGELQFREELLEKKRELERLTVDADIKRKQDEISGKDKAVSEPNLLSLPGGAMGSGIPVVPSLGRMGQIPAVAEPVPEPPPPPPELPKLLGVIGNKAFFNVANSVVSASPGAEVNGHTVVEILNSKEVVVERAGGSGRSTIRSSL